jgi:hypothetical protein
MEEVSGMDLDYFFQRWIYGELYPIYNVLYTQENDSLLIRIAQEQESEVFEMPIDLKMEFSNGTSETTILHNSVREEYFKVDIGNKRISQIKIDPDNWILRKIESISLDTLNNGGILDDFILFPLYPNPFNSDVTIKFNLHKNSKVRIKIFNLEGSEIWTYINNYNQGTNTVSWDGKDRQGNTAPTGTYLVEVSNDKLVKSSKVLLLK